MPEAVVYINGKKVDYRKASISVFDYTLHCAIGLFESILSVDDRLVLLDEHLNRMEAGRERLGLKFNYNRAAIEKTLKRAVKQHSAQVKKTKVLLTYGGSPLWPGNRPKPHTIIIVSGHRLQFKKQKLLISPMVISTENPMRGVKSLNYMTEWMSQNMAIAAGFDQGIIINQHGHVAETGSANIFMVKNNRVYTPPLEVGGLPGITRGEVIRLLTVNDIPVIEKRLTPGDLLKADEIFTSSSFKLIWPVIMLRIKKDYHFPSGPIARVLFQRLKTNAMTGVWDDHL